MTKIEKQAAPVKSVIITRVASKLAMEVLHEQGY